MGPFTPEFIQFVDSAYRPDPKEEGRVLLEKQEHVCSLTQEQALLLGERLLSVAAGVKSLDEMLGIPASKEDLRYTLGEAITEFKSYAHAELALCRQAAADLESMGLNIEPQPVWAEHATSTNLRAAKILLDMAMVIRLVATKYGTILRQMAVQGSEVRTPSGKGCRSMARKERHKALAEDRQRFVVEATGQFAIFLAGRERGDFDAASTAERALQELGILVSFRRPEPSREALRAS